MDTLLKLENICKQYDEETRVLSGVDLSVPAGDTLAIVGESGCGKSTLLNIIGSLDRPTSGSIELDGVNLLTMSENEAARFRNTRIGFIFQLHHLLPQCSVLENVLVPTLINKNRSDTQSRAIRLLKRVGLSERLSHRPGSLSGGERQRVAVVRALMNQPRLLLADEPTGSLNRESAEDLVQLLLELNREENMTLIMVTHSSRMADKMSRTLTLEAGCLK